jgi:branched-chain amino acid transport system permease protein
MRSTVLRAAVRAGAIAGIAVCFLSLVGLLERLAELPIVSTAITMGDVLILLPAAVASWVAVSPRVISGESRSPDMQTAALGGVVTGVIAASLVTAALAVVDWLGVDTVRSVFIAVSPELIDILRFGQSAVVGMVILVAASAATGVVFGCLRNTPPDVRRPVVGGSFAVVVAALLNRVIEPAFDQLNVEKDWLYSVTHGLTWIGAAVVFLIVAGGVRLHLGARIRAILRPELSPASAGDGMSGGTSERDPLAGPLGGRTAMLIGWAVIAVLLAVLPFLVGTVVSRILGSVGIFLLLGLGLNIVVGYAGLLDLGYVAFFAVGAYFTAILTGGQRLTASGYQPPAFGASLPFYVALPIVVAIAALIGLLIGAPVLRLRGDYLAIVTLGFGEIARVLFGSVWLQNLFGGALGMSSITDASLPGVPLHFQSDARHFYYLVLTFCLLAIFVSWRLQWSRIGRAWNAMREDEQVADAMGISTTRYKLLAFAIGGAVGSLGGALFAVSLGSLTIASFKILVSITALAVIILGGLGSIPGVIVGALVLIGLPGLLTQFEDYRLLIYGAVLIAIMLLRPQGLVPNVRRSRELQEDERLQDQWAEHTMEQDAVDAPLPTGGVIE